MLASKQAKQQNLKEFNIPCDFAYIRSKSAEAFKILVKTKAKKYALDQLTEKQQKHAKMEGLHYTEIKPQEYLMMKNARIDQIRNIFRFRVRMARYGENYRGNEDHIMCPLCYKHFDSQNLSFHCEFFKDKLEINCSMSDLYSDNVTIETVQTIDKMIKLREEHLRNKNL